MRTLGKIILFTCLILSGIIIPFRYFVHSSVDPFYRKFTVDGNKNLVLGSSRAARAFNPTVIFENDGLNFSFTLSISPYGKTYFKAIQKMIKPGNGYIVMEVCPIIFSEDSNYVDNESRFRENKLMLGNMFTYGLKTNDEYLIKNFEKPLYRLIYFRNDKNVELHQNGWLNIHDTASTSYKINLQNNLNYFVELNKKMRKSQIRIDWFKKTIELLKSKNKKIIFVRTPIAKELLALENSTWPNFDDEIQKIAQAYKVNYYNFSTDSTFKTQDGSHLGYGAGNSFSKKIGKLVKQLKEGEGK